MTTEEVKAEIASQIGKAEHLKRIIVEQLPEVGTADTNAIYMVSKDQGDQQKYEEFMVINGAWEKIGDSAVDLSGYATTEQMNQAITTAKGEAATDAQKKADAAKTAAIQEANAHTDAEILKAKEAAAQDAQTKATAAQAEAIKQAKAYADGLAPNYATAAQGGKADTALQPVDVVEGEVQGAISVKGKAVKVHGLGDAAFKASTAFDAAGAATAAETNAKEYADSLAGNYATKAQDSKTD